VIALNRTTVTSDWYTQDICKAMQASIKGANAHLSKYIENTKDREAFEIMMGICLNVCETHSPNPALILKSLNVLLVNLELLPKPSFFSIQRWTSSRLEFRKMAVKECIEIVSTLNTKYLIHD